MGRDGKQITDKDRVEMFRMYKDGATTSQIAKHFGFSTTTVGRYKKDDEWQLRIDRARKKATDKIERELILDLTKTNKQSLEILQTFKDKLLQKVKTMGTNAINANVVTQIRDLLELEKELVNSILIEEEKESVKDLTDEQLMAILGDGDN
jgi:hypothetical protein